MVVFLVAFLCDESRALVRFCVASVWNTSCRRTTSKTEVLGINTYELVLESDVLFLFWKPSMVSNSKTQIWLHAFCNPRSKKGGDSPCMQYWNLWEVKVTKLWLGLQCPRGVTETCSYLGSWDVQELIQIINTWGLLFWTHHCSQSFVPFLPPSHADWSLTITIVKESSNNQQ